MSATSLAGLWQHGVARERVRSNAYAPKAHASGVLLCLGLKPCLGARMSASSPPAQRAAAHNVRSATSICSSLLPELGMLTCSASTRHALLCQRCVMACRWRSLQAASWLVAGCSAWSGMRRRSRSNCVRMSARSKHAAAAASPPPRSQSTASSSSACWSSFPCTYRQGTVHMSA